MGNITPGTSHYDLFRMMVTTYQTPLLKIAQIENHYAALTWKLIFLSLPKGQNQNFPKRRKGNIWDVLGETPTSTAEIIQLARIWEPSSWQKKTFHRNLPSMGWFLIYWSRVSFKLFGRMFLLKKCLGKCAWRSTTLKVQKPSKKICQKPDPPEVQPCSLVSMYVYMYIPTWSLT